MRNQVRRKRRLAAVRRSRRARRVARRKGQGGQHGSRTPDQRYADEVEAVTDMNLAIAGGEFMILIGPSGSGESTALQMLAGLEDITEGVIRIDDDIVNDLASRDRDIDGVPELRAARVARSSGPGGPGDPVSLSGFSRSRDEPVRAALGIAVTGEHARHGLV
jgi:ATPase subunit of ABC transporter with duplicated ATPase domains